MYSEVNEREPVFCQLVIIMSAAVLSGDLTREAVCVNSTKPHDQPQIR